MAERVQDQDTNSVNKAFAKLFNSDLQLYIVILWALSERLFIW